jgi:hypothetical protein
VPERLRPVQRRVFVSNRSSFKCGCRAGRQSRLRWHGTAFNAHEMHTKCPLNRAQAVEEAASRLQAGKEAHAAELRAAVEAARLEGQRRLQEAHAQVSAL